MESGLWYPSRIHWVRWSFEVTDVDAHFHLKSTNITSFLSQKMVPITFFGDFSVTFWLWWGRVMPLFRLFLNFWCPRLVFSHNRIVYTLFLVFIYSKPTWRSPWGHNILHGEVATLIKTFPYLMKSYYLVILHHFIDWRCCWSQQTRSSRPLIIVDVFLESLPYVFMFLHFQ